MRDRENRAKSFALLWNNLTSKHPELVSISCYTSPKGNFRSQENFKNFAFKVKSASTCSLRPEDFIYS